MRNIFASIPKVTDDGVSNVHFTGSSRYDSIRAAQGYHGSQTTVPVVAPSTVYRASGHSEHVAASQGVMSFPLPAQNGTPGVRLHLFHPGQRLQGLLEHEVDWNVLRLCKTPPTRGWFAWDIFGRHTSYKGK